MGHGHPLVILHGLFGSSDNWFTLSKVFGEEYRVYAVDQRNHGRSPHSDDFSYRAMADDLNDLLVHEGMSSIYLLGHSMGGKTAMSFSMLLPEKVDKLIVVDIAPKKYSPGHDQIFDALFALKLDRCKTRAELDSALSEGIVDPAVRQLLLKNVYRDDEQRFRWRINVEAIHKNYERINEAIKPDGQFTGPTLFVTGAKSSYVDKSDIPLIKSIFPAAEIVSIKNAGHWIHAEAPQEFAGVVMEFLARH